MNYLEQFKALPKELQDAVSSEEKIKLLEEIEKKYNLKLAKLVIRLMIKDILWKDLEKFLEENFKLTNEKAIELKKELSEKIFNEVLKYLGAEELIETMSSSDVGVKYTPVSRNTPPTAPKLTETDESIFQQVKGKQIEIKEIVKEIKEKLGLTFEDEILEKRFENIISSYLKDVRNEIQLEEILTRSKKIGGMELSSEKVIEILKIIRELKIQNPELKIEEEIDRGKKNGIDLLETKPIILEEEAKEEKKPSETDRNIIQSDVGGKMAKTKEPEVEKKPIFDEEVKKKFEGGTIMPTLKGLEKQIEAERQRETDRNIIRRDETGQTEKEETPIQIRRPISGEKLVEDISLKPLAVGPIEELSGLNLIDFQRWGGEKTCQIIFDKINLLGEESLSKKAAGVSAWQRSPLFRLYLEIGREAMEKKKSLIEIIEERKRQNLPTLEISEFEAIVELNRKLRF